MSREPNEMIGTEWEDRDRREEGRVIQLVAVVEGLNDGYGGPVYDAVCIENRNNPRMIGKRTSVGAHGLSKRWRLRGFAFSGGDT